MPRWVTIPLFNTANKGFRVIIYLLRMPHEPDFGSKRTEATGS
jgi:hypothetical protein